MNGNDLSRNKSQQTKLQEAFTVIGLTVNTSQYNYLQGAADEREAWEALGKVYMKSSRSNHINLKRKFYGYRHEITEPIQNYINGILDVVSKLWSIELCLCPHPPYSRLLAPVNR